MKNIVEIKKAANDLLNNLLFIMRELNDDGENIYYYIIEGNYVENLKFVLQNKHKKKEKFMRILMWFYTIGIIALGAVMIKSNIDLKENSLEIIPRSVYIINDKSESKKFVYSDSLNLSTETIIRNIDSLLYVDVFKIEKQTPLHYLLITINQN
jgi:hypothetical protein